MKFDGVYILYPDPLIVSYIGDFAEEAILKSKRKFDCLMHFPWFKDEKIWYLRNYAKYFLKKKNLHFMTNARREDQLRRLCVMPGLFCNHNAYVNEHRFGIDEAAKKKYDAIYNARMIDWKRHELAVNIPTMSAITYVPATPSWDLHAFCPRLKHVDFNRTFLTLDEVCQKYNEARVGLCLSAREGAMFSSVEYMLCGLPVVSTPSVGGRDVFFDDRYVRIVEPDPAAVARGVQELIDRKIDPQFIRSETIRKQEVHRLRLVDYVLKIARQRGARTLLTREELYLDLFGRGIDKKYVTLEQFSEMVSVAP
jgi:glycosyltransferase involved in cell wall biosynthesis